MRPSLLIVGYGVVGKNLHKIFPWADIHDPAWGSFNYNKHDIALICVPTPMLSNGSCDTNYVKEAVKQTDARTIIIKSTIPPGTTESLVSELLKAIVFSPEFEGNTLSSKVPFNFFILGGNREWCEDAAEIIKYATTAECRIYFTTSTTAELCKYMENSFLAMKVTFCNEFARLAARLGVNYSDLREAWLLDPRIGRSHTYVFADTPYYESKCLDKDIPAIISYANKVGIDMKLMKSVVSTNKEFIKKCNA
jgi:UDPglucose 6-dehydrogenase